MEIASGEAYSRGSVKAVKRKLGIKWKLGMKGLKKKLCMKWKRSFRMAKSFMARFSIRKDLKYRRINSRKYRSSASAGETAEIAEGFTVDILRYMENRSSAPATTTIKICAGQTAEIAEGLSVNIANLLFTPERDFLLKNNKDKVMVDDLEDKVVVLYMVPLYERSVLTRENLDMIQSYNELFPLGGVEFVFVPIYVPQPKYGRIITDEVDSQVIFNRLFSTLPFPAVPFSDVESCGDRVVETFSVEDRHPNWAIIDPTGTVVKKGDGWPYPSIFRLYGGAELYPLSAGKIQALEDEFYLGGSRLASREWLINRWDELLASPTRNYLSSSDGGKVLISSLKGKVIGLYFCDNVLLPPRMRQIKKVYEKLKSRSPGFEIVQINFHYHFIKSKILETQDMSVQQFKEVVSWLTLPFGDPSCKTLQRIFPCNSDYDDEWSGDCLVIIDTRQAGDVLYEFSGAEIMYVYGIEGYPFTRQHLYELEMRRQKDTAKLGLLFSVDHRKFTRPAANNKSAPYFDLLRKRVLVLVGKECESCAFVSMLTSKYRQQPPNDDKFEVVFVSTEDDESRFKECVKGMPWFVHPFSYAFGQECLSKIYSSFGELGAAVFGKDGELVAKGSLLVSRWSKVEEFPYFGGPDLEACIREEVAALCHLDEYI